MSPTSGLGAIKKDLVAMRAWNNAEGRTMQAKLIEVSGTTGQFPILKRQKI
jgi:hypothetical protein